MIAFLVELAGLVLFELLPGIVELVALAFTSVPERGPKG